MKRRRTTLAAALLLGAASAAARPPDILLVIADDLALPDIGAFGGEIATPTPDTLAADGVRLAGFHLSPSCSPTRAMLPTGTDHHRVDLATMVEVAATNQIGQPGYEGVLPTRAVTVVEIFTRAGYRAANP